MTAYEERSYPGGAADTVLTADITSGATAFTVTPGTGVGYPDGSQGPFTVIIDYDNSKAEKIRCSGRVNDTFTVAGTGGGRGYDSTTAQGHTAPAKVRAVWTATDAQEANRAAAQTIGQVTTKGDLLSGSGANTLARTAAGANGTIPIFDSTQPGGIRAGANPALVAATLDATSTLGGVSGTALAADRGAWTSYAPALTNTTGGGGVFAYLLTGKTLRIRGYFNAGTATATAPVTVALPSVTSVVGASQPLAGLNAIWTVNGGATVVTSSNITAGQGLSGIGFTGLIEVQ